MKKSVCKRAAAVVLSMVLLGGCGSDAVEDYATNEGYEETTEAGEAVTTGIAREDIKVGVLYIGDPEDGSGYNYTHDLGIKGMQKNLGLEDEQIERDIIADSDTEEIKTEIKNLIDDGCNVIFATSWGYMEATAEMAEEYPDVYFSHGTGYMSNGKNFNNYFGRIYQARYLSGIVAGMNTKTNKIGYVAAQDSSNSEVTGGIDAFALGIASVNPDAKVYVSVTNSWYDPDKEKQASKELLDMGCDVMAQHCDTAYPQTLAEERGVYGIGYNSDMSKETPDSCLTSVIWNWSAYYTTAVQSIIDGTWDGSNYYGGMQDGLVEITDLASFAAEGTAEKVDEATAKILSGECNVFDGVIKTNTGETVGTEGSTLSDEDIMGGINWYCENVVVLE
ncbi:MAG: BMP family ABC transporter substrate-binding protein [Lachnospiraceae bacterium]|nr:BMP family ABC transporter substrate-binding protein [Lachnospiraceae bacterium]